MPSRFPVGGNQPTQTGPVDSKVTSQPRNDLGSDLKGRETGSARARGGVGRGASRSVEVESEVTFSWPRLELKI